MGDPADWLDQFRDANGDLPSAKQTEPAKMAIAHLHPGEVSASFFHSMQSVMLYDMGHGRRMFNDITGQFGFIAAQSGAGRLERGRNDAVTLFLDQHPAADLLLFIDSDMGFEADGPEILARVVESDPERFPIVGGLAFGVRPIGRGAAQSVRQHIFPTLYRWSDPPAEPGWDTAYEYPRDSLIEVGATGCAFLCIHRTALESMRAEHGDHWFDPITVTYETDEGEQLKTFGEDLSFCMRSRGHGLTVHCHTGVKTSHKKSLWVDEDYFQLQRRPASAGVSIVIPVKDELEMTRNLVAQLVGQGGYDDLIIMDNGSGPEMRAWLEGSDQFDSFDATGLGISEMWNRGIEIAQERHRDRADVVLLNNDLDVCDSFITRLIDGLHSDPALAAVGGNYDGRTSADRVELVHGICANRYDQKGGLPGFAMALRGDWLAAGYRFPESLKWWYGDNDLTMHMDASGASYGIVVDATVEHLDGGSQTDTPDDWDEIIARDRAEFLRLWPQVSLVPAGAGADATAGAS